MYDCIIVGGGIAGLQAAIQLGRYRRKTLVIDRGDGRSTLCRNYHNVLGYPEGVSGETLRALGRRQAQGYGVQFVEGNATVAERYEAGFLITCEMENSLPTTYCITSESCTTVMRKKSSRKPSPSWPIRTIPPGKRT